MKLVKARPKSPEHLPEWAKCCESGISLRESVGIVVLDLVKQRTANAFCSICGENFGVKKIYPDGNGLYYPIDLLDLDEGAYAEK